jgi:hypothetical protein
MLRDSDIRSSLHSGSLKRYNQSDTCVVIDEFVVGVEDARIDIAVINGHMHGFEIKSDVDSTERLQSQISAYNRVFDYLYLVVGNKLIQRAGQLIPSWWGIIHLEKRGTKILTRRERRAESNPCVEAMSIANLLWHNEAIAILNRYQKQKSDARLTRIEVMTMLAEVLPLKKLQEEVREAIKIRSTLRAASPQIQYADLRRSGPMSQRCRTRNLELFLSR